MSYYNTQPSRYSTQNFIEPVKSSQFYSPSKNIETPYIPNQYNHITTSYSGTGNRIQSRPEYLSNSRCQPIIPVSSIQDNRDFAKSNLTTSYATPFDGIRNSHFSTQHEDRYLPPSPINFSNNDFRMSASQPFNKQVSQLSPNYNKFNGQGLDSRYTPYPHSDGKVITQYMGSYPRNQSNQVFQQNRPEYETKRFDMSGYQPRHFDTIQSRGGREETFYSNPRVHTQEGKQMTQYIGSYINDPSNQFSQYSRPQFETQKMDMRGYHPSHFDTIQSRDVRDEPFYNQQIVHGDPHNSYLRQSFGSSINPIPPQYIMNGVDDLALSSNSMGDLPSKSVKRDQNFYYDSYITINGLGTYKKYQLRDRKNPQNNDNNKSQQRVSQSQNQMNVSNISNNMQYNQFLQALVDISKAELEIENIKTQLVNQQDFNIPTFYQFFDKNFTGRISMSEFQQGQKFLGLNFTQIQLSLILTRIVSNPLSQITYEEFEIVCLPVLQNEIGKFVTSRRIVEVTQISQIIKQKQFNFIQKRNLSERTVDLFRRLLNLIYESEFLIDNLRKKIFQTHTKVDQFYRELNNDKNGRMTARELEQGLQKYSNSILGLQIPVLFYRINLNKSTYLTFETFERFCYGGETGKQQFVTETNRMSYETSSYNQYKLKYTAQPKRKEFKIIIDKLIANTNLEVDIQSIQKYLMTQRDLRMFNLFGMFRPEKDYIDIYQFTETLKNVFNISLVDFNDVSLLFKRIKSTKTQPDLIDFNDFCNIIIPKEEQPPKELFDRDRAGNLEFYSETQITLQKLFKAQLNNEVVFNEVRLEIQTKLVNLTDLFDFFCEGKAFLEREDFDRILKENGSPHPTRYHNLLFSRFDAKNEGITNFNIFCSILKL